MVWLKAEQWRLKMAAYKDKNGKWYISVYYTNWQGKRDRKVKRGFSTKREALEWEREFLNQTSGDLDMTFEAFVELYKRDLKERLKLNTWVMKTSVIDQKILPYFKNRKISEIKAADIIAWQNVMLTWKDERGNGYSSIVFWNFGDLGRSDWSKLLFLIVALIPALIYFYLKRWDYKVLCSGDDYAQSMGVYPQHTRMTGMVVTSLITAVAVSFFGVIAFVGLVVPHIVRKCIGDNEEFLIPGSAIFGGMFLLLCDTVARTILSPIILPVGILTSFLGVPLFLFLLTRKKR